jgi:hypothetical protein
MTLDQRADEVRKDPVVFARIQWETWSPPEWFTETEFAETAKSFENPDWVAITLHGYRSRWLDEPCDLRYAQSQQRNRRRCPDRAPRREFLTPFCFGIYSGIGARTNPEARGSACHRSSPDPRRPPATPRLRRRTTPLPLPLRESARSVPAPWCRRRAASPAPSAVGASADEAGYRPSAYVGRPG